MGFFIYGAYLYLTASRERRHQMERGKSAMMTALAGIVLAMVAYGVVELVMNAVVGSPVEIDLRTDRAHTRQRVAGLEEGSKQASKERETMREHEVPTHVQAEDKVLLGFTFPQVVAMTAVCALSYGAYRYAPVEPSEVRMAIAVLLGLAGLAGRRREDRRPAAAPGGRRSAEVPAWGEALRGAAVRSGAERAARAGAAGKERPRPPAADGEAGG